MKRKHYTVPATDIVVLTTTDKLMQVDIDLNNSVPKANPKEEELNSNFSTWDDLEGTSLQRHHGLWDE